MVQHFLRNFKPQYFQINNGGKILVKISLDGTIEYGPDYNPDEATRIFWESIGRLTLNRKECEDLLKFIYDNGYISHEFHEPIYALKNRLEKFIDENK